MKKSGIEKLIAQFRSLYLVMQGFKYQTAKQYLKLRQNHQNPQQLKAVMRLLPFNSTYDKVLNDILSTEMVLQECSDCFAAPYALLMELDGQKRLCFLPHSPKEITQETESLIALLRNKGALLVRVSANMYPTRFQVWCYAAGRYYINDDKKSEQAMYQAVENLPSDTLISEYVAPAVDYDFACPMLHLMLVKTESGDFATAREYIADISCADARVGVKPQDNDARVVAARRLAAYVSRKFYELPYIHLTILLGQDRFILMQLDTGRDLPYCTELPHEVVQLVERMEKHRPAMSRTARKEQLYRYFTSWQAKRKGFMDFMYRNWLRGLKEDNKVRCTTQQEKYWAHQRGFYSYRIKQYHLTEENYRDILSDYDYKQIRPLNCRYHKWLWNKVMAYFVLSPFQPYLPTYYFRLIPVHGKITVIPYDAAYNIGTVADVVTLLRQKGKLALKPGVGSHGEGFYKLTFIDECFYVNDKAQSVGEVLHLLNTLQSTYIVSEYIEMHRELKRIYDKVACTVRVMTICDGAQSPIKNAYFRIGTSFTGNTDNLGSGGIAAPIDLATGRFEHAELLVEHAFQPCATHPDTGAALQGQLPHWAEIKTKIEEICAYLSPLEYLGFDIVITEDAFRILEINTHQDLHKYPDYPQEVKDYFNKKVQQRREK